MLVFSRESMKSSGLVVVFYVMSSCLLGVSFAWTPPGIGVNYGRTEYSSAPLSLNAVAKIITDNRIPMIKMFGSDPEFLSKLVGLDVEVMVSISNQDMVAFATDKAAASAWVSGNVGQYMFEGGVKIRWVAVGNEALADWYNGKYVNVLYPAMQNIADCLREQGLDSVVKVTTPVTLGNVVHTSPPSAAAFEPALLSQYQAILGLLQSTGSRFTVNIYPFLVAVQDSTPVPAWQLMFNQGLGWFDKPSSLFYTNMFDWMVDAVYFALGAAGFPEMELLIGEVGWPSDGYPYATTPNARQFNQDLVRHCNSGVGTPAKPGKKIGCYLFQLLDLDLKPQEGAYQTHWGLFDMAGQPKYPLDFSDARSVQPSGMGRQWCIAKSGANTQKLTAAMTWACTTGGADCSDTNKGRACYNPTSLRAQASFAFNDSFQRSKQNPAACSFNGTSQLTTVDPSYDYCKFRIATT